MYAFRFRFRFRFMRAEVLRTTAASIYKPIQGEKHCMSCTMGLKKVKHRWWPFR